MRQRATQIRNFSFGVMLAITLGSFARAEILTATVELQNRIEAQIGRSISNVIATRVAVGSFDVAVRAQVAEIPVTPPPKDKSKTAQEEMPAGMDLGTIDVREVIESYKRQIEELKLFKEQLTRPEKPEPRFKITRLEVIVGLDERYPEDYLQQMKRWLAGRVKADYGPEATSSVTRIKQAPLPSPTPAPTPLPTPIPTPQPAPETKGPPVEEKLFDLLPYLIGGLAAVTTGWLLSIGLKELGSRSSSGDNGASDKQTIELINKDDAKLNRRKDDDKSGEDAQNIKSIIGSAPLDETASKVIYLCFELGTQAKDLVRVWLDGGADGFLKAALLIDTVVNEKKKDDGHHPMRSALKLPFDAELGSSHEVSMSEAYREIAMMSTGEKVSILEKIYWDLLSFRTLGLQSMRRPFDYTNSLNDVAYANLLKAQDERGRAIALLFADNTKSKYFLESAEKADLERVVTAMTSLAASNSVSADMIWAVDAQVRGHMEGVTSEAAKAPVNMTSRIGELLGQLQPIDEIWILRRVIPNLPDQGVMLKQHHVSLAFVNEWHPEFVSKLVGLAGSVELAQLIYVVPEARDVIFGVLPERMRLIVEDDLRLLKDDPAVLERGIRQLTIKWKKCCEKEKISMSNVISFNNSVEVIRHAA